MKDTKLSQNWMSIVGFIGEAKNGFCTDGTGRVITDYVELCLEPGKNSPLFSFITYTVEDWKKDFPEAKPFIEKDGKHHGDYYVPGRLTMFESIDRIIAYVHFNHDTHDFNTIFFEVGNIESRDSIDVSSVLSAVDMQEIIDFAKQHMQRDFAADEKEATWMYGEYADDYNIVDIPEGQKRIW